jgi:predicted acyltransferase
LVFPAFLFIVGITLVVSLQNQKESPNYKAIIKRSILLFALGLFLNLLPNHYHWDAYRIYGVLQRIAICYLACSLIYLHTSVKTQLLLFITLIVGYWYFITQIPMPGHVAEQLLMNSNWVGHIDQMLFASGHLYTGAFDPEGGLSTLTAIATTLSGVLTGTFLLADLGKPQKCMSMCGIGVVLMILGWSWNFYFPINKALWTSSYVLWTSGISLCTFALCYMLIDIFQYTKWALPFKILGMNALFIFVFHVLLLKLQFAIHVTLPQGRTGNLKEAISQYLFGGFSPPNSALFYALVFLFFNFLVVEFLYWRRIFIRL